MAEQSVWQRMLHAVQREYDRRLRRASALDAAHSHAHEPAPIPDAGDHSATAPSFPAAPEVPNALTPTTEESAAAEISNVPLGTPLRRRARLHGQTPDSE